MTSKVATIYFAPVKAERLYGGPYEMPGVPLNGDPVILTVTDRVQIEQGPYQLGSNGKRSRRRHIVLGEVIARCIVGEWTEHGVGMNPQCRPGIWAVRERVPLLHLDGTPEIDADGISMWREATADERHQMWQQDLAAARLADKRYANLLFLQANAMAEEPKLIPFIAPNARLAAKHYGYDAEWLKDDAALNVKSCQYCTKVIPAKAVKCPKCTEVVDVEAYAVLEMQKQVALKAAKDAARAA